MNFHDLTDAQCDELREQLTAHRLYLRKLLERMQARGWNRGDEFYRLAEQSADATDKMWITLHYRACDLRRKSQPPRVGLSGDSTS